MGFKMPPILALAAMVCAGVGLLFQIIGVATDGWVTYGNIGNIGYSLWNNCAGALICVIPDWLGACRAFGILGVLVLAACLGTGILMCFKENALFVLIAAALGFAAAFCMLIEFAVFADNMKASSVSSAFTISYGYSFALTIIAFLLSLATGTLFLLVKFKGSLAQKIGLQSA